MPVAGAGFIAVPAGAICALLGPNGTAPGLAALAIGHHRSVLKPAAQKSWRFTSGALIPDCALQVAAIFAVGLAVQSEGVWLADVCIATWLASLLFYGWRWDRQALHD